MSIPEISASEVIERLIHHPHAWSFMDVRSEDEWKKARSPGFRHVPFFNRHERCQIEAMLREGGEKDAIKWAEELLAPQLESHLQTWIEAANGKPTIVCSLKGEVRSFLVANHLRHRGVETHVVAGGFHALRKAYVAKFDSLPSLHVLSGLLGVGRHELLRRCFVPKIDLRGLANHQGGLFNRSIIEHPPTQITFENFLSLQWYELNAPILIEDANTYLGPVQLPDLLRTKISESPIIRLEATMDERVDRILHETITDPMTRGFSVDEVREHILSNLAELEGQLGKALKTEIENSIITGFNKGSSKAEHGHWIALLLESHFDPVCNSTLASREHLVRFQGDFESCLAWIEENIQQGQD